MIDENLMNEILDELDSIHQKIDSDTVIDKNDASNFVKILDGYLNDYNTLFTEPQKIVVKHYIQILKNIV